MHPLLLSALIQVESNGNHLSDESLARLWQGGPKAFRRSSSRAYGRRIMRELEMQLAGMNETRQ